MMWLVLLVIMRLARSNLGKDVFARIARGAVTGGPSGPQQLRLLQSLPNVRQIIETACSEAVERYSLQSMIANFRRVLEE